MTHTFTALGLIIFAGGLAALQAPMNAALGRGLGSGSTAAMISFGVGFIGLLAYTLSTGEAQHVGRATTVNPLLLLGGLLGAFYIWAILFAVPHLGVVTAVSAMILGQLVVGLWLDANGVLGLAVRDVSLSRILGVALVGCGLALAKI